MARYRKQTTPWVWILSLMPRFRTTAARHRLNPYTFAREETLAILTLLQREMTRYQGEPRTITIQYNYRGKLPLIERQLRCMLTTPFWQSRHLHYLGTVLTLFRFSLDTDTT